MKQAECEICLSEKTALKCKICDQFSCKHCTEFVDDTVFEFQDLLPENLRDSAFCPNCFEDQVQTELTPYIATMELAKEVNVYGKEQGKETRLMRRVTKQIKVTECGEREEAYMRLAYIAAQQGFDTIADVSIVSRKVNLGGRYRRLVWDGSATPIDTNKRK